MYLRARRDSESVSDDVLGDDTVFTVSRTNKLQKEVCVLVISAGGLALEKKRRGGKRPRVRFLFYFHFCFVFALFLSLIFY